MIIPSFSARGGIATVVSGYKGSLLEQEYEIRYIETYVDGGKTAKLRKALSAYGKYLRMLLKWRPELVHVHVAFGPSFYRKTPFIWGAYIRKIPVVVHIHGSELDKFYSHASKAKQRFVRKTFAACQRVIVLSDEWKRKFANITDPEKVVVVQNYGIPSAEHARSAKSKMVLFLGFLSKAKGCLDIPDVAKIVNLQFPETYWVLAGSATPEEQRLLKEKISENKLQNRFVLPGWVQDEEKTALLQSASVFFLPSYSEAMPMSVLEAMSWGLPIISTTVGGIPQLVKQKINGYLIEPGDIDGFADRLKELLSNDTLRQTMGEQSLRFIKEYYSFDGHLQKIMSIYRQILENEKM